MAHIAADHVEVGKADTPTDWLPVGAFARDAANAAADRGDLVVKIGPGLAAEAGTAMFVPAKAEIQVDSNVCLRGVKLDDLDLTDRLTLLTHPAFAGALIHEAAHARHTKLPELIKHAEANKISRRLLDVVIMLEEPRIEARTLRFAHKDESALPGDKADWPLYFTTMALDIVLRDFRISDDRYGAAAQAALILARVDGGSFLEEPAEPFATEVEAVLGEETVEALREIWTAHFTLDDDDFEGFIASAQAWLDVLEIDADDDTDNLAGDSIAPPPPPQPEPTDEDGDEDGSKGGEGDDSEDGESKGEASASEGEGEGENAKTADGRDSTEKFQDMARKAQARADAAASNERKDERNEREAQQRREDAKRREEAAKEVAGAFHGYSDDPDRGGVPANVRKPTPEERRAAVALGKTLAKVSYRDRSVTKVSAAAPPGRLKVRALVGNAQARQSGGALQDPFVGKRRRHVDETPLTIGFIQDVSGSMGDAEVPMASTSWVIGEAGRKIDALVAGVLMGTKATGVTRPGKHYENVREYSANAGHECFRDAFLALDGVLNLVEGNGARVLFIASDGQYGSRVHGDAARKTLPLLKKRGVAVVWLRFTNSYQTYGHGTVLDVRGMSPAQIATACGVAALAEFRKVQGAAA
jgi:hypothetical protein